MRKKTSPIWYVFLLFMLPLTMGSICANLSFVTNQIKWRIVNPPNYRINVILVWLRGVEITVTVRQGEVVATTFATCEKDQSRYNIQTCQTLKSNDADLLKTDYSVIGLFEKADCLEYLKDRKGWECSVKYDSKYGYPTEIIYRAPLNYMDGTSIISVTYFHVDE